MPHLVEIISTNTSVECLRFFKQGSIRKLYQRKCGSYGDMLAPTAKLSLLEPMADKLNKIYSEVTVLLTSPFRQRADIKFETMVFFFI